MKITNGNLAAIVTNILTCPTLVEIGDKVAFEKFCTDIAEVVAKHYGRAVAKPATYAPGEGNTDWRTHYVLEVEPDASSPVGGVWAQTDAAKLSGENVKHHLCYEGETADTQNTHEFEIFDEREQRGLVIIGLDELEGDGNPMYVHMEVGSNPLDQSKHVPCAHVYFDDYEKAISVFKTDGRILICPDARTTVYCVEEKELVGMQPGCLWVDPGKSVPVGTFADKRFPHRTRTFTMHKAEMALPTGETYFQTDDVFREPTWYHEASALAIMKEKGYQMIPEQTAAEGGINKP